MTRLLGRIWVSRPRRISRIGIVHKKRENLLGEHKAEKKVFVCRASETEAKSGDVNQIRRVAGETAAKTYERKEAEKQTTSKSKDSKRKEE